MKISMKYVLLAATLFVVTTTSLLAQRGQGNRNPEAMAERQTKYMVKELDLNDEQTTQVQEINLAFAKKLQEARKELKGDREAMQELRAELDTARDEELKAIFTEEQFATYQELKASRGKGKKGKKGKKS